MPAGTCRVERRSHSRGRRRRREETRNARLAGLCGRLGQRDGGPGAPVPCWPRGPGFPAGLINMLVVRPEQVCLA
jgi:hypothetical protein